MEKIIQHSKSLVSIIGFLILNLCSTYAQVNGPTCDTYTNAATTLPTGLGSNTVYGVFASGSTAYAATSSGLTISTDGGATFTNKTTANGLGSNTVYGVFASGSTVYAATSAGLCISTDGGATFTKKTTTNGLGNNIVKGVFASGSTVYAATSGGLSISIDSGKTFTNKTTANGLGSNAVNGVYASGIYLYAATNVGLGISIDSGKTFTNKNVANNGLGNNIVNGVYASGSTVYAATAGGLTISTDGGTTFTNKTVANNGLGNNIVKGVYASGSTVYAATSGGLSISTDGGTAFTNKTSTNNGLGSNIVYGVFVSGSRVYAATVGGLSISTDGGTTFTNTTATKPSGNGLGNDYVNGVYASGSTVYAATNGGLSISTDGGKTFTNKTTANGLGNDFVYVVFSSGSTLYAATNGGLSKTTDGGTTFTNKTTLDGLGNNIVFGVFVSGTTVYAATNGGLGISTDTGKTFTNKTLSNSGLGSNTVYGVFVSGSTVYAATAGGLSISSNGGVSFTNKTVANGLGSISVTGVFASGSTVYASTGSGLSISTNGGASFTNKTVANNGLGNNSVNGVFASGSTVYAATNDGLSISIDSGATFTNKTTTNGLGNNSVTGVYASATLVYAATGSGLSFCSVPTCTPNSSTETHSACDSLVWHGTTYKTSNNTATWTGTNAAGCDSVVTLHLTIKNSTTSTTTQTASGSYSFNGSTYTSTGTYTWSGTNAVGCDSVATLNLTICNNPTSGGAIAAAQSGISPFDPAAFTSSVAASGQTGTIEYKWQSSTTSSSLNFSDIASSNTAIYDAGVLTVTTWFKRLARAACKSDWTGAAESNVLEITVTNCINPTSGGTIAAAQNGINPFTPAAFTSSVAASGQTGTIEYKWQSSTTSNSAGFADIASSNAATYTPGALTVTTWFKRLARVSCSGAWSGAAESNVLEITVTNCINPTSGGTILAAQSGINPFSPAAFTSSVAASGQTGTLEYKWQSSTTSNSAGFADIASSNAATYTAGTLTVTTWFKRLARVSCSGAWSGAAESNVLEITVTNCINPTSGGTILAAQSGINPFTPAAFTSSAAASGQTGTLEYKWQSSTTSNSAGFADIASSNAATYTPGALTVTTWFKRLARVSCSGAWSGAAESNVLEITVTNCINPTSGGTIAAAQSGINPFTPAAFSSSVAASGQTGTIEYKWQSSTTSNSAGFADIASSNAATYTPGALTVTTWYKRLARVSCSGAWSGAAESNVLEVTVANCTNPTAGGTIAAAQSGNSPFNPAAFTSSVAASGETGTLEYKWQSSTTSNSSDFIDIASSNAATYDAGALTQTTWFRRLARVTCSGTWSGAAESNVLQVTVILLDPQPVEQPTNLFFTNSGASAPYNLNLNYTASTTAAGYLVVRKTGTAPTFVPVDGSTYTAGAQGSDQIIYVGSATIATDYAVTTGETYYYAVYAYFGSGATINYLTVNPLMGKSIVKTTNSEPVASTSQSVSAGFPGAGVNITFPNGTPGSTITAAKTNSAPAANFSVLPGVRGVVNQYFTITSTNASAGTYTLTLDFSGLGLSPSAWTSFKILKRANATAAWLDITTLGATILNRQTDGVWGKFTITGLSSFSDFTGGAEAVTTTVTTTAETGAGSLKQAIANATAGDFINFDTTAMGGKTITLSSPVVIDKDLTIQGANGGITLNGNHATRVMDISDSVVVRLDRLKIENGYDSLSYSGGIWNNGNLTMVNCVVSGNAEIGEYGVGGILQYSAAGADNLDDVLNLINCTITGNTGIGAVPADGVGGLSVTTGIAIIYNTIIYGNTGDASSDVDITTAITLVDHSDIGNLDSLTVTTNTTNISSDPGFAGAANAAHPFAITGSSPAADAGGNSACLETTDIRGGSFGRKLNKTDGSAGTIDMGAYEFGANAWTGATNNNFNTATNWSYGTVPATAENFNIPTGNPQLNVDYTVGGTMIISGTGKLTINAGKTLSVGAPGTADFGGKAVTIKSDATGTGAIGQIEGTLTGATNVTVERYIATAKRAWRFLTVPVTGTTLRNAWAGASANATAPSGETAGSGTLITGHGIASGATATAAGFDWFAGLNTVTTSSIRFYSTAANWSSASNTPNLLTTPNKNGYMLFIRGDRTVTSGSSTTTLKPTGTLKTGTQTIAVGNAYEVIGNPYASSIDLDAVYNNDSNSAVINRNFWVWDATLGTSGAYRALSYNGSGYDISSVTGTAADYLKVQSGQAFFVEMNNTGGNITIKESNKTGNASVNLMGSQPVSTVGKLAISLYQATGSTLTTEMDGVLARFGSAFQSAGTDDYDVAKISNFNENLGLLRGDRYLSIDSRPYPAKTDTLFAPFWNLTARAYALKIGSTGINGQLQGAKLVDAFTKTETALNLNEGGTMTYPFSVTSDAASSSLDRFMIVMTAPTSLPVSFTSVNATPKTTGIDVTWKTGTEVNVKDYGVERSSDGINFTSINSKTALNANNGAAYNYLDMQPLTGKNYYRIRSNDRGGDYHYSAISTANWNGKAGMGVYPTAVTQGQFTVQLSNQPAGNYKLSLTTIAGRQVYGQSLTHAGGSGNYGVKTGSLAVGTGVYQLTITSPDGRQESFRLLISNK